MGGWCDGLIIDYHHRFLNRFLPIDVSVIILFYNIRKEKQIEKDINMSSYRMANEGQNFNFGMLHCLLFNIQHFFFIYCMCFFRIL